MRVDVVVGSGPLGWATARELASRGGRVRLVGRSLEESEDSGIELARADATIPGEMARAVAGAQTVYHCANAPYHLWARDLPGIWNGILAGARDTGARLVVATNLYSLGRPHGPITAAAPLAPCSRKGRVRAGLEATALDAHRRGEVRVALVRASDFYGPGVTGSVLGSRFFSPLLRGRPAEMYGQRDVPHSYAYLSDFAATMATVGTGGDDVWGRSWIAPHDTARTVDELETELRRLTHGARVKIMGKGMLGAAGLFVPAARETVEMLYEFEHPFVVDSSETETRFGIQATEMSRGLGVTLEWYRESIQEGRDSERTPHARTAQEAYPGRE